MMVKVSWFLLLWCFKCKELDGATVCIQTGTTTELNLADFFRLNNISYEALPIETNDEGKENLFAGRCDVYTTDASGLSSTRAAAAIQINGLFYQKLFLKNL